MNLVQRTLVAVALFGVAGAALARAVELVDPDPVSVPAGWDQAKVVKAIKRALVERRWSVSKEEPGYIEATLNVRKHMLKVGITYGRKEVKFKYVDSAELNYKERDGVRYIHGSYNKWVNTMRSDIAEQFLNN